MMHDFRRDAMSGNLGDFESRLAELFGRSPGGDVTNRVELRRAGDDTVSITRVLCEGRRRGTLEQHTHHLLVIVGDGEAAFTPEDGATVIGLPNAPVLLSGGHRYAYDVSATRFTLLQISSNFVRNRAAQRGVVIGIGAVFSQPATDTDRLSLMSLVPELGAEIASADTDALARIDIANTAADALLQALHVVETEAGLSAHVAAAEAWIRTRLREDITTGDIAAAVGISVRTLQEVFRRELNQTPTAFLRAQRLERVREALLDPADGVTVSGVAREWGFRHGGRFSEAYNDRFGEFPRITLSRSRRRAAHADVHRPVR
ncbi:helix-turn-helix domain-containing protein [Curtobacterium sp. TC1]|uniref:AraC family transcriptional regulator n=1 Tax=Curtobacterium sp. TC1 TaxID=2862880 RepID=UPI001C9A979E|nr:helix-turn-helix domain-containing protein [Curtobacterium sp. TC1]QZQ55569.1 helix-turn-helix domain-containing protein [Curtobacterium sp. TC1]